MAYLNLLWCIPIVVTAFLLYFRWQRKKQLSFGNPEVTHSLISRSSGPFRIFKTSIRMLVLVCLILAMANPRMRSKTRASNGDRPKNLVFAIDVSNSMRAEDVFPSRLQKAKSITMEILDKFNGESVGIVLFAGQAFPYLPLTADHHYAVDAIRGISIDHGMRQGTSFKQALELSGLLFDGESASSKTICVISDGESHSRDFKRTADSLRRSGVKLLSIALGSVKGAPIPVSSADRSLFKKDKKGRVIISGLNPKSLKQIAGNDPEHFFAPGSNPFKLDQFLDVVYSDKGRHHVISEQDRDYYTFFLWVALGMMLLETLITAYKGYAQRTLNRTR
ncbi:vWA domain-containing protein [Pedobacter metabolipauper]|nr:VWA domain-containing protein [Pedobacter metabolipauper]